MGEKLSRHRTSMTSIPMDDMEENERKRLNEERKGGFMLNLPLPYGSRTSLNSTIDFKNNNRFRNNKNHFQVLRQLSIPCDLDKSARYGRKISVSMGIFSKSKKSLTKETKETELPDYFSYQHVIENDRDSFCSFCERKAFCLKERIHGCRVCDRTYHESCLKREGFCLNGLSAAALRESTSTVGWSCPDCANLFNLLTDDEKQEVIDIFTNAANEGGIITRDSFMVQRKYTYFALSGTQMPESREKLELALFEQMNSLNTGYVDWWDFLQPMAIRILSQRSPMELMQALSQREVQRIKAIFQEFDMDKTSHIPSLFVYTVFGTWYQSFIARPRDKQLETTYSSAGQNYRGKALCHYENELDTVSWDAFLENLVLHILAARPNTVWKRPYIPWEMSFMETAINSSRETLIL